MKNKEQQAAVARQATQIEELEGQLSKLTVAREQAESVIDRQGQRMSNLQEQVTAFEKKTAEQSAAIEQLTAERDAIQSRVPSEEDAAALAEMASLLTTKKAGGASKDGSQNGGLRMNTAARAEAA